MVGGVGFLSAQVEGADAAGLRTTLDGLRKHLSDAVILLIGVKEGKVWLLVSVAPGGVKQGVHAGNLLKELAPIVGGKGGGKADLAQGGGTEIGKVNELLANAEGALSKAIAESKK
jgi:alanyl-tRNA synthetase